MRSNKSGEEIIIYAGILLRSAFIPDDSRSLNLNHMSIIYLADSKETYNKAEHEAAHVLFREDDMRILEYPPDNLPLTVVDKDLELLEITVSGNTKYLLGISETCSFRSTFYALEGILIDEDAANGNMICTKKEKFSPIFVTAQQSLLPEISKYAKTFYRGNVDPEEGLVKSMKGMGFSIIDRPAFPEAVVEKVSLPLPNESSAKHKQNAFYYYYNIVPPETVQEDENRVAFRYNASPISEFVDRGYKEIALTSRSGLVRASNCGAIEYDIVAQNALVDEEIIRDEDVGTTVSS